MTDSDTESYSDFEAKFHLEDRLTRRASKSSKKIKKRGSSNELLPTRASGRQQRTLNGSTGKKNSKGRGKKCIAFTKTRNAERLSKELNTTIHLLNLTVKADTLPTDDVSDHDTSVCTTTLDTRKESLEEVFPDLCDVTVGVQDWPEDQENMLQTIEALHVTEQDPGIDHQELPQQVQKTIDSSEEAIRQLKLLDLSESQKQGHCTLEFMEEVQTGVKISLQRMNEIIEELQDQNCSLHSSGNEVGSVSSIGSLATLAQENCRRLGLAFQQLLDTGLDTCLLAFPLLDDCFASCKGDLTSLISSCLPMTLDLLKLYSKLSEMEIKMTSQGIGPVRLIKDRKQEEKKLKVLRNLIISINESIRKLQKYLINEDNMKPSTKVKLSKSMSPLEFLKQGWNWLCNVSKRVGQLHNSLKAEIHTFKLETFLEATQLSAEIQSTDENLQIINSATSLEKCEIQKLPEEEILTQEWLLPTIQRLYSHVKDSIKRIQRDPVLTNEDYPQLGPLQKSFIQLILLTISRMYRTTLCCENVNQKRMENRRFKAMETTRLIQKFLEGPLIDRESELDEFDTINKMMNDLITTICTLNSKLQFHRNSGGLLNEQQSSFSGGTNTSNRAPLDRCPSQEIPVESSVEFKSPFQTQESTSEGLFLLEDGSSLLEGVYEMRSAEVNSLDQPLRPIPSLGKFLEVDCTDLEILNPLGSGSSANVYLMNYFGIQVAVKVAKELELSTKAELRMEKEAEIHQRVNYHPQIVRYLGKYMDCSQTPARTLGIIMEFCELGSLTRAINEARWLMDLESEGTDISTKRNYLGYHLHKNWSRRLMLGCQVAAGMSYLHHQNIVHRDLTSYNVVLYRSGPDEDFGARICDFERSNYIPEGQSIPRTGAFANSPPWSAPEVLNNEPYTTQADVFSMGVVLWELMYLENPWEKLKEEMCSNEVVISCHLSNGSRLPLSSQDAPDVFPEFKQLVELVKLCWRDDPQERPSMGQFHKTLDSIRMSIEDRFPKGNAY